MIASIVPSFMISHRGGNDLYSGTSAGSKTFTVGISLASWTLANSYCFGECFKDNLLNFQAPELVGVGDGHYGKLAKRRRGDSRMGRCLRHGVEPCRQVFEAKLSSSVTRACVERSTNVALGVDLLEAFEFCFCGGISRPSRFAAIRSWPSSAR